jgi:3-(3-hydroxy-phenyl)propionate hydroxylase
VQDAENLAWKLDAVLRCAAGDSLLDSYAEEREYAADENILNSTRATDFITPKSEISRLFRDAVLQLSKHHPFARTLVNSGRLSVPATLHTSPLNTPDADRFEGHMVPGAAAADAPVRLPDQRRGWLLRQLGPGFTLLLAAGESSAAMAAKLSDMSLPVPLDVLRIAPSAAADGTSALADVDGLVAQRYDLQPGNAVLLRPDHHVCARWRHPDADTVRRAVTRALAIH